MRILVDATNKKALEELTGKVLTHNGNEIIAEVIEMAESSKNPDSPCWMESNCSEQDEEEVTAQ